MLVDDQGPSGAGADGVIVPLIFGASTGISVVVFTPEDSESWGVFLPVIDEVSVSSGMVANFLKTCLSAGRRIGLLKK